MLFVNPLFLALGLGALAVPIVIHLMRRKQARVVPFSTLRFLMAVDQRLARRNKLRELLLLCLRLAALALLALALAQPSLESLSLPGLEGPRARIIVVDDSASMNRRSQGDSPFDTAREGARAALEACRSGDPVCLLTLSQVRAGSTPAFTSDRNTLFTQLEKLAPGHGDSRPDDAFFHARSLLDGINAPRREILFITDLPEEPWSLFLEKQARSPAALEADIPVRLLVPACPKGRNLSLEGVEVQPVPGKGPDHCRIEVRVKNHDNEPAASRISLTVDRNKIADLPMNLPPHGSRVFSFPMKADHAGLHRGMARLEEDHLVDDNRFYFLFKSRDRIRVLLLASFTGRDPYEDPAFYLRRALAPLDGQAGENPLQVVQEDPARMAELDLSSHDVVILVNPPPLDSRAQDYLEQFVRRGGRLMILAGGAEYEARNLDSLGALCLLESPVTRTGTRGSPTFKLEATLPDHPLLQTLAAMHPPVDLHSPAFFEYLRPSGRGIAAGDDQARVLLRFKARKMAMAGPVPEGSGDPALVEQRLGQGTVLFFLNSLAPVCTDFPFKVSFVPFLHSAVAYLTGRGKASWQKEVGHRLFAPSGVPAFTIHTAEEPQPLLEERGEEAPRAKRPGFYRLQGEWLAVNVNPEEGNPACLAPERAAELLPQAVCHTFESPTVVADLLSLPEDRGSRFFTPLLLLALGLLAVEPFLANRRISRGGGHG